MAKGEGSFRIDPPLLLPPSASPSALTFARLLRFLDATRSSHASPSHAFPLHQVFFSSSSSPELLGAKSDRESR